MGSKVFVGVDDKAINSFHEFIVSKEWPCPKFYVATLPPSVLGCYNNQEIFISSSLVDNCWPGGSSSKSWIFLMVMLEEYGHYIDYQLRNIYSNIGEDSIGDEGERFAKAFIENSNLLECGLLHVATIKDKENITEILVPESFYFAKRFKIARKKWAIVLGDSGTIETFKIGLGPFGRAVHEIISEVACNGLYSGGDLEKIISGSKYPDHCDGDPFLVYESHYGKNQFWHSMCYKDNITNQDVAGTIMTQAEKWYSSDELRDVGKLLHMIQDSFSHAHTVREVTSVKRGDILNFQSYNAQDSSLHGLADTVDGDWRCIPGANRALKASRNILELKHQNKQWSEAKKYLEENVFKVANSVLTDIAGGTSPEFESYNNHVQYSVEVFLEKGEVKYFLAEDMDIGLVKVKVLSGEVEVKTESEATGSWVTHERKKQGSSQMEQTYEFPELSWWADQDNKCTITAIQDSSMKIEFYSKDR